MQGKTWTKATAGSTGEPLQLDYNPDSYDWRWAVTRRGYAWAGHEEGMRQVSIWGLFTMGERKIYRDIKEKLHHRMQGRLIVNALKLDERTMPQAVELINDYDPVTIVGYTNPLYQFAQYLLRHGGLRVRPKGVISAAEKLFDYQRPVIEEGFGCQGLRNLRQSRGHADRSGVRTAQRPASEHGKPVRRNPQGRRYAGSARRVRQPGRQRSPQLRDAIHPLSPRRHGRCIRCRFALADAGFRSAKDGRAYTRHDQDGRRPTGAGRVLSLTC